MSWAGDRWKEVKEGVGGALSHAGGAISNWWKDTGGKISGWWHSLPPEVRLAIVMAIVVALGVYAAIYFAIPFTFGGIVSIGGSSVFIPILGVSGGGATAILVGAGAIAGGAAGYAIGSNQSDHGRGSDVTLEKHGDSGHPTPQVSPDKGQGQQPGGGKSDEGAKQGPATPSGSRSETGTKRPDTRSEDKPGPSKQTPTQLTRRDDVDTADAVVTDGHLDESAIQKEGFSQPTCVAADLLNQSPAEAASALLDIRSSKSVVETPATERISVEDFARPYLPSPQQTTPEKSATGEPEKSAESILASRYRGDTFSPGGVQLEKTAPGASSQIGSDIRVTRDPLWRPPVRAEDDRSEKGPGGGVGATPTTLAQRVDNVASSLGTIRVLTFEQQREEVLRSSLARMSYISQVRSIPGQIEAKFGQVRDQPVGVARQAAEEAISLRRSAIVVARSQTPSYVSSVNAAEKIGKGMGDPLGYRNVEDALAAKGIRPESATSEDFSRVVNRAGTPGGGWNVLGRLGTAVTLVTYAMDVIRWKQELENGYMDIPTLGGSVRLIFDQEKAYRSMEGQPIRDSSGRHGRIIGGSFVEDPL